MKREKCGEAEIDVKNAGKWAKKTEVGQNCRRCQRGAEKISGSVNGWAIRWGWGGGEKV